MGFENISKKVIGKFLRNSEFENVDGIMAAFKIWISWIKIFNDKKMNLL